MGIEHRAGGRQWQSLPASWRASPAPCYTKPLCPSRLLSLAATTAGATAYRPLLLLLPPGSALLGAAASSLLPAATLPPLRLLLALGGGGLGFLLAQLLVDGPGDVEDRPLAAHVPQQLQLPAALGRQVAQQRVEAALPAAAAGRRLGRLLGQPGLEAAERGGGDAGDAGDVAQLLPALVAGGVEGRGGGGGAGPVGAGQVAQAVELVARHPLPLLPPQPGELVLLRVGALRHLRQPGAGRVAARPPVAPAPPPLLGLLVPHQRGPLAAADALQPRELLPARRRPRPRRRLLPRQAEGRLGQPRHQRPPRPAGALGRQLPEPGHQQLRVVAGQRPQQRLPPRAGPAEPRRRRGVAVHGQQVAQVELQLQLLLHRDAPPLLRLLLLGGRQHLLHPHGRHGGGRRAGPRRAAPLPHVPAAPAGRPRKRSKALPPQRAGRAAPGRPRGGLGALPAGSCSPVCRRPAGQPEGAGGRSPRPREGPDSRQTLPGPSAGCWSATAR